MSAYNAITSTIIFLNEVFMAIIFMNLIEDGVPTAIYKISGVYPHVSHIDDSLKFENLQLGESHIDIVTLDESHNDKGYDYILCHMLTQPEQYATKGPGGCYDNYLRAQSILKTLNQAGICPLDLKSQLRYNPVTQILHQVFINVTKGLSSTICYNAKDNRPVKKNIGVYKYKDNLSVERKIREYLFPHRDESIDLNKFTEELIKFNGGPFINANKLINETSEIRTDFSIQKKFRLIGSKIDDCGKLTMNITERETFYYHDYSTIGLREGQPKLRYLNADSPSLDNGKFDLRCAPGMYNAMQHFRMQCESFINQENLDPAKFEKIHEAFKSQLEPLYCNLTSPTQNVEGEPLFSFKIVINSNNTIQSNLSKPPLSLSQVNGAVYNNIEPSESSDVRTTVIGVMGVMGIVAGAAIVVAAGSFVMSKVKNAVKSWYYNDKNQNVSSGQNHPPTLQSAHNSKQVIPMNFIIKNDSGRLEEFDAVTNSDSEQIPPSKITHVSNSLVNSELQQNVSCA